MLFSLALYIPFIVRFLTGLEALTLRVAPDQAYLNRSDDPDDALAPYEALAYVFENKLRTISSLTKLEVLELGNSPSRYEQGVFDVAKPTIRWFENRSEKKTRAAFQWNQHMSQLKARQVERAAPSCTFCREAHAWEEC
ncbi:hypothetical protein IFR05_011581 [Cadophora sp. M221]|nr:hypothetical protein IFR05_011581 [Cadophora sp. M221]